MTTKDLLQDFSIRTVTKSGLKIVIRPIKNSDGPLLEALFQVLSPKTLYFRFFMRIKAPSPEMIAKLLNVDHDRDVVLAATEGKQGSERILGVFRLMCCREGKEGEFSLLVGDPWQGKGVGARLFQYGLFFARARGIESIWGMAVAENSIMRRLARKMGFAVTWDGDMGAYEMRMAL
jgi:acetyltransferase